MRNKFYTEIKLPRARWDLPVLWVDCVLVCFSSFTILVAFRWFFQPLALQNGCFARARVYIYSFPKLCARERYYHVLSFECERERQVKGARTVEPESVKRFLSPIVCVRALRKIAEGF